jgi:hypothetical protein
METKTVTKKINTTKRVRSLINKGYNNKDIIDKLKCKPQAVYAVRYQINKQRGLGSIGGGVAAPVDGIGTPPKRKAKAETGIVVPYPKVNPSTPFNPAGTWVEIPITMIEPEPWWKVRVKNLARALGWRG